MVQGVGHKEFLKSFFLPILNKDFTQKKEAIDQYNRLVVESLSSRRLVLEDSVWSAATPDKELRMKLRRKATCNKCGKEFQGVTHLKLHMNNAHSDMTRAKPRVSDRSSRQLVTTIQSTIHPPGIETDSIPALTYDADSELLLDSEESEQEVIEEVEYFSPARPCTIPPGCMKQDR